MFFESTKRRRLQFFLLLGNEAIFSLETASDYMKDEKSITYGFKCLVIGYDWITPRNGLKNLEMELAFLGGACAASLMKKNLTLPPVSSTYFQAEKLNLKTWFFAIKIVCFISVKLAVDLFVK